MVRSMGVVAGGALTLGNGRMDMRLPVLTLKVRVAFVTELLTIKGGLQGCFRIRGVVTVSASPLAEWLVAVSSYKAVA